MAVIHISKSEAIRDISGITLRVNADDEVSIGNCKGDCGHGSFSVSVAPLRFQRHHSCLKHGEETSASPAMDGFFADNVEQIVGSREPGKPSWDFGPMFSEQKR